jgi:hypothetical protein
MTTYNDPLHNAIKLQEKYGCRVAAILFYIEKNNYLEKSCIFLKETFATHKFYGFKVSVTLLLP